MNCNLKTLKIYNNKSSIRIALTTTDESQVEESYWYISKIELPYVINRLLGNEQTNFMINDLAYHLQFGTNGIYCSDSSNGKVKDIYITFPGSVLAMWINDTIKYIAEGESLDIDSPFIEHVTYKYRNQVKVVYYDFSDEYNLPEIVAYMCKHNTYVKRAIKSLIRQAGDSCQAGEGVAKVNLQLDSYSERKNRFPSLYFWLERPNGTMIYNGGIINHGNNDNPEYSIHT